MPEELWIEVHNTCIGGGDQNYSQEKEIQEGKEVVRRPYKYLIKEEK